MSLLTLWSHRFVTLLIGLVLLILSVAGVIVLLAVLPLGKPL